MPEKAKPGCNRASDATSPDKGHNQVQEVVHGNINHTVLGSLQRCRGPS